MRDLKPVGIPVELGGVERRFLFTLNVIDAVQGYYDATVLEVLNKLFDAKEQIDSLRFLVTTLINDEIEREKWMNPSSDLKEVTEKEVGWMINVDNISTVTTAILAAYRISIPDSDEEQDPNAKGEQQSN